MLRRIRMVVVIILISWILLEVLLQLSFNHLPSALQQRLPQAPIRYGIRFDTTHGAREYPAYEQVNLTVGPYSGDLFAISCLSPMDAEIFNAYNVRYTRDAHGFRNQEPWPQDVHLVVVGDSFTAAESINSPFWMGITDATLAFGLPGSGSLEQSKLLNSYGISRRPEIVLMAYFSGNDLTDTWRFYQAEKNSETLYEMANHERQPWEYLVTFQSFMLLRDIFFHQSRACHYPITIRNGESVAFYDEFLSLSTLSYDNLITSALYQQTRNAIVASADNAKMAGATFILMYIPHKSEVYWDLLTDSQKHLIGEHVKAWAFNEADIITREDVANSADLIEAHLPTQRQLLTNLATTEGFLWLDLTPYLQQATKEGLRPYFFADTHWNQNGHDFVRSILQAFLRENQLIAN